MACVWDPTIRPMSVKFQDYYASLGVARDASQDEIQRAYRKLARQYHPDVNKSPGAEDRFRQIGEAYEVLKDPDRRRRYDQLGADYKAGQDFRPPPGWQPTGGQRRQADFDFGDLGGDGAGGFSDFFESLFGSGRSPFSAGRPSAKPRTRRGQTQEASLTISLTDAYHGATRRISLDTIEVGPDGDQVHATRTYDVKIPPGTTDGSTIRLKGQGGRGSDNGAAGDLLLHISIALDPRFRLDGHDLITTLPIVPWEAALGAKVPVATLDGEVLVSIPPGSQSGQRLRLRGKGLPQRRGEHGDLYAELKIVVPKEVTPEARALYEQLAKQSNFDPRKP